jgi:uncharacterized protein (TIGR02145 family)
MNSITTIRHGAYRDVANNTAGGSTYEHPTFDPHGLGLYKVAVTHEGHVNQVEYVSADDIIPLGIQGELTAGVNITIDEENVISADDMRYDDTDIVAAIEAETDGRATADANLQLQIDNIEVGGGASVNTLIYLGHLNIDEPTTSQLTTFAQTQAQTLFNNGDLKTGYTVRDAQDRDWRWVDDGDLPPPPPPTYTVSANITGDGSVTGAGNFPQGATIIVTAIPSGGWELASFVVDGATVSSPHTFTMPNRNITAAVTFTAVVVQPPDNRMYDPVDDRYYDVIESGGLYWTVENFARTSAGVFYNNAGNEPFPGAGKLYTYAEAIANAPAGWRLPSQAEYAALVTAFGNMAALKSTTEWATANSGTNNSGFNMPPAGYHNASGANYLRERASFWTSDATNSRVFILANSTSFQNSTDANYLISVRYVKEAV